MEECVAGHLVTYLLEAALRQRLVSFLELKFRTGTWNIFPPSKSRSRVPSQSMIASIDVCTTQFTLPSEGDRAA